LAYPYWRYLLPYSSSPLFVLIGEYKAKLCFSFSHSLPQRQNELAQNAALRRWQQVGPRIARVGGKKCYWMQLALQRLAAVLCHTSCIISELIHLLINALVETEANAWL